MSRSPNLNEGENHGFPRVSGDEPGLMPAADVVIRFSPRERG